MSENGNLAEQKLSQVTRHQSLRRTLRWALGLHVALFLITFIGLPTWRKPPMDLTKAVHVDLVAPTGEFSAAPNKSKSPDPFVENAKKSAEKTPPKAQAEKPPAAVKSDAAKKDVVKKPVEELKKPEPKPAEKPVEKPKKAATEKAPEKPKIEPKKKPEPPKKSRDDGAGSQAEQQEFNSVLKNLLGDSSAVSGNPVDAPYDPNTKTEGVAPVTSETLSLSELDALRNQFRPCWNAPTGAANAENLIVEIRIVVNPDRTVKSADIVDQGRYRSDDFYRAAADSARRAALNPACQPLPLSPDKYDTWKNLLLNFDPRDMLGF